MRLFIVHYHMRAGGVRRVIELATPHIMRLIGPHHREVVLATGEAPDAGWLRDFRAQLDGVAVVCRVEPALNYFAEQRTAPSAITRRLRSFFASLFGDVDAVQSLVWAHNQGLGRNLLLTRELTRACAARGLRFVLHHHDWWFDYRWQRWAEMPRAGFRSLAEVAGTVFPRSPTMRHAAINRADFAVLQRHFPTQSGWVPNPVERHATPSVRAVRAARRWLSDLVCERNAPVWLLPCRLLRRKNIAEALLLTRWLRPEAWLVTTAGVSSEAEADYGKRLATAAREHDWRLRLSALDGNERRAPTVPELMAASEAILLTSIQEGFGLPFLEATATKRPLLCRALPNVAPDLTRFGFHFPQCYEEIMVDTRLLDWRNEHAHQSRLFARWRDALPTGVHRLAQPPRWLARDTSPRAIPFSRLTLSAQLDVLAQPVARSWKLCAPLNPFLRVWQRRAAAGRLQLTRWPRTADRWLSGPAYARRFAQLAGSGQILADGVQRITVSASTSSRASVQCQGDFIRAKLRPEFLYPLLWNEKS